MGLPTPAINAEFTVIIMKTMAFILRNVQPKRQAILYAQGAKARHIYPLSSNPYIGISARIWTAGWKGKKLGPKNIVNVEYQPLLTVNAVEN